MIIKSVTLIEESSTSNLFVLDDFNAAIDAIIVFKLLEICKTYQLVVSNHATLRRYSG